MQALLVENDIRTNAALELRQPHVLRVHDGVADRARLLAVELALQVLHPQRQYIPQRAVPRRQLRSNFEDPVSEHLTANPCGDAEGLLELVDGGSDGGERERLGDGQFQLHSVAVLVVDNGDDARAHLDGRVAVRHCEGCHARGLVDALLGTGLGQDAVMGFLRKDGGDTVRDEALNSTDLGLAVPRADGRWCGTKNICKGRERDVLQRLAMSVVRCRGWDRGDQITEHELLTALMTVVCELVSVEGAQRHHTFHEVRLALTRADVAVEVTTCCLGLRLTEPSHNDDPRHKVRVARDAETDIVLKHLCALYVVVWMLGQVQARRENTVQNRGDERRDGCVVNIFGILIAGTRRARDTEQDVLGPHKGPAERAMH
eukprot:PhM_4_TR15901/c0_g1_i1/m.31354